MSTAYRPQEWITLDLRIEDAQYLLAIRELIEVPFVAEDTLQRVLTAITEALKDSQ